MPAAPLFVSSGDPLADRRYRQALEFLQRGDAGSAANALEDLVAATPRFATAWFALAAIRDRLGDRDGAIAAFTAARDADQDDYHGARLQLARLGVGEPIPAMTATYVRRLFDQYAPDFDTSLVERLDYRGPQILRTAIERVSGPLPRFGSVLDLGCGTGLAGLEFRPFCDRLVGVDISSGMIEQARTKGIYDELVAADLLDFLAAATDARHQLVLAADVFVYCNDLTPIVTAVANVMAPGGLFAFTVESHERTGVLLRETLRFAHGTDHVRAALAAAGLELRHLASVCVRTEKGEPVEGLAIVAGR